MTTNTLARSTDPITSKLAGKTVKQTPLMMRLLKEFAKKSMTSELAAEAAGLLNTGYWKRVSDLQNVGYIEVRTQANKPMTWVNRSGRQALVWKITPVGRNALKRYQASL